MASAQSENLSEEEGVSESKLNKTKVTFKLPYEGPQYPSKVQSRVVSNRHDMSN